jgi:transposase
MARLSVDAPSRSDWERCLQGIRWDFWRSAVVEEAQVSMQKLRPLRFGRVAKPPTPGDPETSAVGAPAVGDGEASPRDEAVGQGGEVGAPPQSRAAVGRTIKPRGGPRPGTGRLGAEAYAGATRVECRHEELAVGQRCPVGGQGNRSPWPAGGERRSDGKALRSAVRSELEKRRCSACGELFPAGLPAGGGEEKYSAQARAVLAGSRYDLGGAGYRLQGDQTMLGGPVPEATPWEESAGAGDCAYTVFAQRARAAAQGEVLCQADPAGRLLSWRKEHRDLSAQAQGVSHPHERPGMPTTALAVPGGEPTAMLYSSSRRQAGENLQRLLDPRQAGLAKPLAMSAALRSNEGADAARRLRCHCLAHGRRKFSALEAGCPHACQVVLAVIRQGFDPDAHARQDQLRPAARLAYHQAQRQPRLDERKGGLATQREDSRVAPNRALGKAIPYLPGHWTTLTRL